MWSVSLSGRHIFGEKSHIVMDMRLERRRGNEYKYTSIAHTRNRYLVMQPADFTKAARHYRVISNTFLTLVKRSYTLQCLMFVNGNLHR
jgi:hypothetical protein